MLYLYISLPLYLCRVIFNMLLVQNESINGHHKNASFLCADVTSPNLKINEESVDLVFSNWLLMYLADDEVITYELIMFFCTSNLLWVIGCWQDEFCALHNCFHLCIKKELGNIIVRMYSLGRFNLCIRKKELVIPWYY